MCLKNYFDVFFSSKKDGKNLLNPLSNACSFNTSETVTTASHQNSGRKCVALPKILKASANRITRPKTCVSLPFSCVHVV